MIDPREHLNAGAVLTRKQPAGDSFDRLRVEGFQTFEGGNVEVVVRPVEFGPAIHVDVESLAAAYEIEGEGAPTAPWETPIKDAILRCDSTITDRDWAARMVAEQRQRSDPPSPRIEAWRKENPNPQEDEQ